MERSEFLMYGLVTREVLDLGVPDPGGVVDFSGPIVVIDRRSHLLPPPLVRLLIRRFRDANLERGVLVGNIRTIYEDNPYLEDPAAYVPMVGGDADDDVPLASYLPEITDPATRTRIAEDPDLRL